MLKMFFLSFSLYINRINYLEYYYFYYRVNKLLYNQLSINLIISKVCVEFMFKDKMLR